SISDLDAPSDFSESDESVLIGDHKLSKQRRQRLVGRYGDIANQLVEQADIDDLTLLGNTEVCLQELFWACENEAVEHLDDLLLRRVRIGMLYPEGAIHLIQPWTELLRERLQWPIQKWDEEWHRYKNIIADHYSLPNQKECV
ncbi:glycerol-3-phosphate dehydrogenase C-terminal domain-containing protein, partial [Oleiphilus sp. HI0067]